MKNDKIKQEKIKDLCKLYDILLKHLDDMCLYTTSIEVAKANIGKFEKLNEFHKGTRKFARNLLEYDFSKLSKNFVMSFVLKEINPQSILFINVVTRFNENIIMYINENDDDKLQSLIKEINEFRTLANTQFKQVKEKLELINK